MVPLGPFLYYVIIFWGAFLTHPPTISAQLHTVVNALKITIFRPHPPSSFADVIYEWNLVTNLISSTTFVRSSLEMGTSHVITEFSVRTKMSITIFAIIGRVHHLGVVLPASIGHNWVIEFLTLTYKIISYEKTSYKI